MNNNNNNTKNSMNNNLPNDKNKVININHYHYNNSNNRRKNNRSRNNRSKNNSQSVNNTQLVNNTQSVNNTQNSQSNNLNKPYTFNHPQLPPSPLTTSNPSSTLFNSAPKTSSNNQKSHIIIRSTANPSNMRIIPFTQPLIDPNSSLFMNNNFLNGLFPNKKENKIENPLIPQAIPELKLNALEEFVELNDIKDLDDLIRIGTEYDPTDKRRYPIDMNKLKNIIESLKDLKNVIGMESVKKNIFEQLLYILQELNDSNMMHTVIEGPPGVGKTLLGKIIAKIYFKLNFLKKSEKNKDDEEINDITNQLMAVLNPAMSPIKKKDEKR